MKKVLASVLAGSMVLGMASMASAAGKAIKKNGSGDYDFGFVPAILGDTALDSNVQVVEPVESTAVYEKALEAYKVAYANLKDYIDAEDATAISGAVADLKEAYADVELAYKTLDQIAKSTITVPTTASIKTAYTKEITTIGISNATDVPGLLSLKGKVAYDKALAINPVVIAAQAILKAYPNPATLVLGNVIRPVGWVGAQRIQNKDSFSFLWTDGDDWNLYTYGDDDAKDITIRLAVPKDEDLRIDVAKGAVKIVRKKVPANRSGAGLNVDVYDVTIKADAGVRDFELADYKVEFDCHDSNLVFFVEGKVAYSDYRDVEPDERYINQESNPDDEHNDGCVYNFDQVIDEETRIICNDYVDVLFKGNYGTDFENMRVLTDGIKEVEDFFQDFDIDYYDFVGTPKFAKDVTVRVDADSDSYIYEFDKKTGDVVDITDECEYTSDGWTFKRKLLKTYVIIEEPYEGGNVRADKEPVDDEPTEPDDTDAAGSKPNPGTGAMPF